MFQFLCPKYSSALATLRFGDHDRLAHPTDCSKFYACLLNGQPRVGSCPAPTVFDVTSGFCTNYKKVEGCENFYDHLRFKDVDYVARPIVSDAPARKMAFVEEAPVRSALTGSTKNFFNFEQKNQNCFSQPFLIDCDCIVKVTYMNKQRCFSKVYESTF